MKNEIGKQPTELVSDMLEDTHPRDLDVMCELLEQLKPKTTALYGWGKCLLCGQYGYHSDGCVLMASTQLLTDYKATKEKLVISEDRLTRLKESILKNMSEIQKEMRDGAVFENPMLALSARIALDGAWPPE